MYIFIEGDINKMKINKLHINRKACALVCAGVIAVAGLTGCSSVDKEI